jgi:uncharacterized protein (DUF983 family)
MPYVFICPSCGGRSYSAAANSKQPCPYCGHLLDPSDASDDVAGRAREGNGGGDSG